MIERILVALDGSKMAEAILPALRPVLRRSDSELILARVVEIPIIQDYVPVRRGTFGLATEYLAHVERELAGQGARVSSIVWEGAPADTLPMLVESTRATMVAMATHGRSGLSRLVMGSVAEQVIRKSLVPVLVVRPDDELPKAPLESSINKILVPLDGSVTSLGILPAALELASLFGSDVVLLRVLEPDTEPGGGLPDVSVMGAEREYAREELKEAAWTFRDRGLSVRTVVEEGEPAEMIQEIARRYGCDLVAMSTHGRSGLSRMLVGSVTEAALRVAKVPFLIVPERAGAPVTAKDEFERRTSCS